MREIKFRAWDKIDNKFIKYMPHLSISLDGKVYNLQTSTGDEYELSQYTGLKDKNGKEIYEWDIVKDLYYFRNHPDSADDNGIAIIRWHQCGFIAHYNGIELFSVERIDSDDEFEVIGNIYQHSHLLKRES